LPIILAYHGCDLKTAQELLSGSPFQPSTRDYDWLGEGSYFWENDVLRAFQWASEPRRKFAQPSVVGAAIELGNCLDLTTQSGIAAVNLAHDAFIQMAKTSRKPIPQNQDPEKADSRDRVLRRLDCAVINYLFELNKEAQKADREIQAHPTVRALFPEGKKLYENSGFRAKTHVQICVRESRQIIGVFRIPEWQRDELELPVLY
jgi:hypothetical protein